ncbi:MAG TPA: hypothetical protein ENN05_07935 [Deltaproteobacteria bacterium]|nr:hypothetical protein [Deltaproteobacteria bacterium]
MRRKYSISIVLVLAFVVLSGCSHHWGYDRYHSGGYGQGGYQEGWTCAWCGQGPGMMGPYGGVGGMGPEMMGPYGGAGGTGLGMMGSRYGAYGSGEPLTEDQTRVLMERSIGSTRNPNIMLGKLTDKKDYFEAEIVTKDGSLVDKVLVDKRTGWIRPSY